MGVDFMKKVGKYLFILFIIFLLLLPLGCTQEQKQAPSSEQTTTTEKNETTTEVVKPPALKLATASQGTSFYAMGAILADMMTKAGVPTSTLPGGGDQNIIMVSEGKSDLGFSGTTTLMAAHQGADPYDKQYTNVVAIAKFDNSVLHVIVPKDSPIETMDDLKGKTVAGPAAGSSSYVVVSDVLKACGIDENKDLKMVRGSTSESVELFKDRHIDGFLILTASGNASIQELTTFIDTKFVELPSDIVERVQKLNPGYLPVSISVGTYPGIEEEYKSVGYSKVLVANEDAPEDYIYWVAKTLTENLNMLKESFDYLKDLTPEYVLDTGNLPTHPGAKRCFDELKNK